MPVLFNNCRGRKYNELYSDDNGTTAFYDLNTAGRQAEMATNLQRGDVCVVAAYEDREVVFKWYSFSHELLQRNPNGTRTKVRVLWGNQIKSKSKRLAKAKAWTAEPYSDYFNVLGNFTRRSVI